MPVLNYEYDFATKQSVVYAFLVAASPPPLRFSGQVEANKARETYMRRSPPTPFLLLPSLALPVPVALPLSSRVSSTSPPIPNRATPLLVRLAQNPSQHQPPPVACLPYLLSNIRIALFPIRPFLTTRILTTGRQRTRRRQDENGDGDGE